MNDSPLCPPARLGPRAAPRLLLLALAVGLGTLACSGQGQTPMTGGPGSGGAAGSAGGAPAPSSGGTSGAAGGATASLPPLPLLGAVQTLSPGASAGDVCADTSLRLTFKAPVTVGAAGKIQVWQAGKVDAPVDVIDLGAPSFEDTIAGRRFFKNRPVIVEGNDVIVLLHVGRLQPGARYFVTLDAGVLVDAGSGAPIGALVDPAAFAFSTRAASAPADPTALTVAADGSGDFCTVQAAVDFVPAGNTTPVTVTIKAGIYREIVLVSGKNKLTFHGADRAGTVITYANNELLQKMAGTKFRALFSIEANGVVVENLTIKNSTPASGSQSEAIRVDPGDQVVLRNANFLGQQDTMLLTGRVYVANSTIEGNVDFVWGSGAAYFERCELKTVGRKGYGVQARNAMGASGFVFVDSRLTADPGITGHWLARIDISGYPYSQVAFINCQMGPHIAPVGWNISGGLPTTDVTTLRFSEFGSTDLAGAPLDLSTRTPLAKILSDADAATVRDKATFLRGWVPTP